MSQIHTPLSARVMSREVARDERIRKRIKQEQHNIYKRKGTLFKKVDELFSLASALSRTKVQLSIHLFGRYYLYNSEDSRGGWFPTEEEIETDSPKPRVYTPESMKAKAEHDAARRAAKALMSQADSGICMHTAGLDSAEGGRRGETAIDDDDDDDDDDDNTGEIDTDDLVFPSGAATIPISLVNLHGDLEGQPPTLSFPTLSTPPTESPPTPSPPHSATEVPQKPSGTVRPVTHGRRQLIVELGTTRSRAAGNSLGPAQSREGRVQKRVTKHVRGSWGPRSVRFS